jgi:hypothetical protein
MFDEDLDVFFDTDDSAAEFTLVGSEPVLTFPAITGSADEEALQGFVVGTERKLQWPTAAATLRQDQILSSLDADGTTVNLWRVVRDGRQISDGAESVTFIVPHQA